MQLPILSSPHVTEFYIDGEWSKPASPHRYVVIDPAHELGLAEIALGSATDVDKAVGAARRAFPEFSRSDKAARIDLLHRILERYLERGCELAHVITREMGAPIRRTTEYMIPVGRRHLEEIIAVMNATDFVHRRGGTCIRREPIGVCGLITPWNAPILQILSKVAPALAAGCTMILKPSELSPLNAVILAEIMHEAGVPPGVFNLVNGRGSEVGEALARHEDIDMVSFTGSTSAGIRVAEAAAQTVKRVHQELGGKAANIILPDVDLEAAIAGAVRGCCANSGQSCVAPARMLVPRSLYGAALEIAKYTAEAMRVGDPLDHATELGPLASDGQRKRVRGFIAAGISEGATLVTGGTASPAGVDRGFFVRPTVFSDVTEAMTIAQEEIFGPVVSVMPYDTEDDAIRIANGTRYGLAAHIQCKDVDRAARIAAQLRVGYVYLNYAAPDYSAPFGGYGKSGNGREYGAWGLDAFQELKSIVGLSVQ